jgi:AAA domain/IclR helix-turn-helix domain
MKDDEFSKLIAEVRAKKGKKTNGAATPRPITETLTVLQTKIFPPIAYVVPGYIAAGCTILAGRPKIGKSWLMLDTAIAVALGPERHCLGNIQCAQGDVLYLALEDNERRMQNRVTKILGISAKWPEAFHYQTQWPRANEGGLDGIRAWIAEHPRARLVVIDTLAMFRSPRRKDQQPYECDYEAISGLQKLAGETGVAIVVVHHLRKAQSEGDPFEKVSGTMGLTGAADTVLVLDRDGACTTLYGRGRDTEEIESAMEFNKVTCRWTVLGPADEIRRSKQQGVVLAALGEGDAPMTPAEVAETTGISRGNTKKLLSRMFKAGTVYKPERGRYRPTLVVDNTAAAPAAPVVEEKLQPFFEYPEFRPFAVGDLVQVETEDILRLERPTRVRKIFESAGQLWADLEGYSSSVPVATLLHVGL